MPELPEVEVFRRYVDKTCLKKKIEKVHTPVKIIYRGVSTKNVQKLCKGQKIKSTTRRGKHLFLNFHDSKKILALHFGMTGYLIYEKNLGELPEFTCLAFEFSNNYRVSMVMPRKLGSVEISDSFEKFVEKHDLGPDFLDLDKKRYREKIKEKKGAIKTAIMDQSLVSGLGNIYSDEILFQSFIRPETKVSDLRDEDFDKIWSSAKKVLKRAIKAGAEPDKMPDNFLVNHRQDGERCPKCKSKIKKKKIGGRSSYFCPDCQK